MGPPHAHFRLSFRSPLSYLLRLCINNITSCKHQCLNASPAGRLSLCVYFKGRNKRYVSSSKHHIVSNSSFAQTQMIVMMTPAAGTSLCQRELAHQRLANSASFTVRITHTAADCAAHELPVWSDPVTSAPCICTMYLHKVPAFAYPCDTSTPALKSQTVVEYVDRVY